ISTAEGLSQNTGNCIIQDHKGFMWFGTEDGLNKYDGYKFTIYRHDPKNPDSISNSYITAMYEDRDGVLWIGTAGGGLNKFDREKEKFIYYMHDEKNPLSLSNNFVLSIYEDSSGNLWIGTERGLNKFDRKNEKFIHFLHDKNNPYSISDNRIFCIYEDRMGNLWIGTQNGLNKFLPDQEKFISYYHDPKNPYSLSNNVVRAIFEDKKGNLWIGTDYGLNKFDRKNNKFIHYVNNPENPWSISNDLIRVIYEDRDGNLWIGTYGGGLNLFDRKNEKFYTYLYTPGIPFRFRGSYIFTIYEDDTGLLWIGTYGGGIIKLNKKIKFLHYSHEPDNPNSLNSNMVFSIYEDRSGILWIGTYGGGLNKFDRKKGKFTHYMHDPKNPYSLSNNNVRCITEDNEGNLWIGTYKGLNKFDRKKEKFVIYKVDPNNPNSLSSNYIRALLVDREGNLWIGTYGGLHKFDKRKKKIIRYKNNPNDPYSISDNRVFSIYEDKDGNLWIGTLKGLNKFDKEREKFTVYKHDSKNPESLSNNFVLCIYEDRSGILWVGTYGGGLNKFDRKKETFTHYTTDSGLPNNVVYGILEDEEGNLWLSTNNGLSKFNPKTETFRNYDISDGLQGNEFNSGAYFKSKSGEMFFGGINGFNSFYPSEVKNDPYMPEIVITDFRLFNKSLSIGEKFKNHIILEKSITETKEIILPYNANNFTIEFSALHFVNPHKNQYAYKLEGIDKDWNYVGNRNFATYTNLHPGEYVFKIIASNCDGIWNNKGMSLKLRILPPFWMTWWFRGLLVGLILGLIFSGYWIRTQAIRRRAKLLEKQVEERTIQLRKINEEIKRAYSILQVLISQFPQGVILTNPSGKIILSNPLGEEYINLIGEYDDSGNITHFGKYSINEIIEKSKKEGMKIELESPYKKIFKLESRELLLNSNEKGILFVIKDVTEELLREEVQKQQERLALIGKLAAGIAHDFNNILTAILGNCELIQLKKGLPDEIKNRINAIIEQGERASTLIKQILDFSRRSISEMKPLNLLSFLKETLKLLERTIPENIKIEFNYSCDEYWAMIDIIQFQQVITNIALNAKDAMPYGGKFIIELSKKYFEGGNKPFVEMKDGEWIILKLKDTGVGIPEENLPHIFEPFFTTKPPGRGTGLGLSQVYGIVKQHNGYIRVESKVGKGASFIIYLPAHESLEKIEIGKEEIEDKLVSGKREKILVVEDDESILHLMKMVLERLNYNVIIAKNGKEALNIYEKYRNEISLIISDMIMPEISGIELIKNLREKNPKLKIMLITGYPLKESELNFLKKNSIPWIQKPFKIQKFSEILRNLFYK
ncbi:ATP-binding protein, partial [Candidatus Aminicenantes bacterium AC-335-G13]|nr:ATP-binding protein [Candidatus Aminicenantes bacterium AC-335-G13]